MPSFIGAPIYITNTVYVDRATSLFDGALTRSWDIDYSQRDHEHFSHYVPGDKPQDVPLPPSILLIALGLGLALKRYV
jgi:hypothetical protein